MTTVPCCTDEWRRLAGRTPTIVLPRTSAGDARQVGLPPRRGRTNAPRTYTVQDNGPNGQGDVHSIFMPVPALSPSNCVPQVPGQPVADGDISVGCQTVKDKKKGPVCRDRAL